MRARVVMLVVVVAVMVTAGCRRTPRPEYEYGPTETHTSTGADAGTNLRPARTVPLNEGEPVLRTRRADPTPPPPSTFDEAVPSDASVSAPQDEAEEQPPEPTPEPGPSTPRTWYDAQPW